jgi:histidinol-phosphate aminotransferase
VCVILEGLITDSSLSKLAVRKTGKPIEELQEEYGLGAIVRLFANENPLGPSPLAVEAVREAAGSVHRYPGICEDELRSKIANLMGPGFNWDNVLVANGSCDVLRVLCQAFLVGGGESIICPATFPLYGLYTKMFGGAPVLVEPKDYAYDLSAMSQRIGDRTRLIFVCNPNNPTGTMLTQGQVDEFMEQVPERVVVVFDEAYCDYVEEEDYADVTHYIREGRNVIITRTFSKIYGLAGLRVGYAIAKKDLIEYLLRALSPYHVGALSLIGATAGLNDEEHIQKSRERNAEQKRYLYKELDRLDIRYIPTQCNFILLVDLGRDVQALWQALVSHGVVVQQTQAFGVPDAIRITIGTDEENERLVEALEQVLREVAEQ